jgi:predicted secreted protein
MSLGTCFAVYLVIWWTVLFAVLPLGVVTHAEAGIDKGDGGDPGAPVDPKLKRKFITTTWVAAVIFAVVWVVITMGWFTLPTVPGGLN